MTRKRAPGGGRKPLYPLEKTMKVAVTLRPAQVEAMKQLGNGNLSAGIRKAIEMSNQTRTHYVNEEALGDEATKAQAERMVELLQDRGIDAEYGDNLSRPGQEPIDDAVWLECLGIISQESYA